LIGSLLIDRLQNVSTGYVWANLPDILPIVLGDVPLWAGPIEGYVRPSTPSPSSNKLYVPNEPSCGGAM
jgi:hypothetical protein